jgi:hypothetical protein
MEDINPFGPLSNLVDDEEEMADTTDKFSEETSLKTQAAANYQGSQEGWEDDFEDLVEEADGDDYDDYHGSDMEHRRRKVSQGPRDSGHTPNMTFAFAPHPTRTQPGQGQGGGMIPSPKLRLGSLLAIKEGVVEPETEEEDHQSPETKKVGVGRGLTHLLAGPAPPEPTAPEKQQTMFTYRAQLTWGLDIGPSVDLPTLFRAWVTNTSKHIPNFSLVPFEDELGQVISTPEQVPVDNVTFYQEYYHNHCVLRHGNLTGMVQFRCSVSGRR